MKINIMSPSTITVNMNRDGVNVQGYKILYLQNIFIRPSRPGTVEIIYYKKIIQFDCIDTWLRTINDEHHKVIVKKTNYKLLELFLSNIKPVNNTIKPIVKKSMDTSFIDTDHSHEAVIQDVKSWLTKDRKNVILAIYDYITKHHHGVEKAIDEIFENNMHNKQLLNLS